jgi:hypothetical protein
MPADLLSRSFVEMGVISVLNMNWAHKQEKDNLSSLIRKNLNKKWMQKFPMPDWYKKAELLANMVVVKNKIIWIKKNDKLLLYIPFELLFAISRDLLTGHDGLNKCKERLMECYFWLNIDKDILKHIKEYLKRQTKSNKFPTVTPLQPMPLV